MLVNIMDMMTSSVLREANNSLEADHAHTSVSSRTDGTPHSQPERAYFPDHLILLNSHDMEHRNSLQLVDHRSLTSVSQLPPTSNGISPQKQRPQSTPPGQSLDTQTPLPARRAMEIAVSEDSTDLLYSEILSQSGFKPESDSSLTYPTFTTSSTHRQSISQPSTLLHPSIQDTNSASMTNLVTAETGTFYQHITTLKQHAKPDCEVPLDMDMCEYLNEDMSSVPFISFHSASNRHEYINGATSGLGHNSNRTLELRADSNSVYSYDNLNDSSNRYDDSDYSNISTEFYSGQLSSGRHSTQPPPSEDHFDRFRLTRTDSPLSTASVSSQSISPSPSSQTPGRDNPTGTKYQPSDDDSSQNPNSQSDAEMKVENGKNKGMLKSRGAQNLPPCRVCGNVASGLHFGVNTCEACNEFFRRSLKRGATYYCSKTQDCQVYLKKRNACSFCRYKRCVDIGMSRDAIKTGRYSHKTRTEYAMEVERCKLKEVTRAESQRFESLLTDLVKCHDKYVKVSTRVSDEELQRNQSNYFELYNSQHELERRHPPLKTSAQKQRLLEGWTASQEDLSLTMHDAEMTEIWLRNYINYAKNVPGFKELALSDQASLVRGSWFEFWFLGAFRGYNSKLNVVAYPNGRCFHRDEIQRVFGQEYTDFSFQLADRMRSLDVTPEVMVLVKTVCLTAPDRASLDNKKAVEQMHWLMVSCLLHSLQNAQSAGTASFALVVGKLVELRTLTDIAMRAHKSALFQDVLKESPLLCEMVDTKTRYVQCPVKNTVTVTDDT